MMIQNREIEANKHIPLQILLTFNLNDLLVCENTHFNKIRYKAETEVKVQDKVITLE